MKKLLMAVMCCAAISITPITAHADTPNVLQAENLSEAEKYARETLSKIPQTVSADDVPTAEKALEKYIKYFDSDLIDKYGLYVYISFFSQPTAGTKENIYGKNGSFRIVVNIQGQDNVYRPITIQAPYYQVPDNEIYDVTWSGDKVLNDYFKRYLEVLIKLADTGVSMSQVNSIGQAYEYVKSLAPDGKDDNLFITVEINETIPEKDIFKKAVAGTVDNPEGKDGWFHVWINIRNLSTNDTATMGRTIPIWATPYKKATSSNVPSRGTSSTRGSNYSKSTKTTSSNKPQGVQVSKPNIILGLWEQINGKWKLKISDGSYAASQWAYLGDKWYFLGNDGYMLTGWQMVNGKWYYMDGSGAMLADTITPDGYQVNASGEWVE